MYIKRSIAAATYPENTLWFFLNNFKLWSGDKTEEMLDLHVDSGVT